MRLSLLGNLPELSAAPVLETAVVLHASKDHDLDLTLDRGRILVEGRKEKGPTRVRLRFRMTELELELDRKASVALERSSTWRPGVPFLKKPGSPNIPIQAIGLSLYEELGTSKVDEIGTKVTRTQWLDLSSLEMENLIGKNVLIVDEVDDTRTTLDYAVRELQKDVEAVSKRLGRESEETRLSIFVLKRVCTGFG